MARKMSTCVCSLNPKLSIGREESRTSYIHHFAHTGLPAEADAPEMLASLARLVA